MIKFVRNIILGVIIIASILYILDNVVTLGLQKSKTRKYQVWNEIYSGEINADVLVLGSSRALKQYNPAIIDTILCCNSYNLGADGQALHVQLAKYRAHVRYNTQPKLIIMNVDYISTFNNSADARFEREQYFPYIHKDKELYWDISQRAAISWWEYYVPFVRYSKYRDEVLEGIHNLYETNMSPSCYKGFWCWPDGMWQRASLNESEKRHFMREPEAEVILNDFVLCCRQGGIPIILVKSPIYIELTERFDNLHECDSIFEWIESTYHVPLLDYYHDDVSMDSTNFYNPSHLCQKGANAFTIKLCNDIKEKKLYNP